MRELIYTLAAAAVLPASALAAEEGAGPNLFAGDIGVAFWTLLIFLVVVFILGRFAWRPLLAAMQRREEYILDSLDRARSERQQAEQRLAEYERRLAEARAEATAIVEEGRRDAESVKARLEATSRVESERMIARARREIELARDQAVKDLYTTSAGLATELAAKVLRREIRPEDHERLLAESLRDLESRASN